MFHRHKWKFAHKTYAPPGQTSGTMEVSGRSLTMLIQAGMTTYVYKCEYEACGDLKKIECYGKEVPQ